MTIKTLFSSYCLNFAKIMIINDATNRFTELFPNFTNQKDEDFKTFELFADDIVKEWYYDRIYNRFVITIDKEEF